MPRRRRRIVGLIPRSGRWIVSGVRWLIGHPQPFVLAGVAGVLVWALWGQVRRADLFHIQEIVRPAEPSFDVPAWLVGQNIWGVNLAVLADTLRRQHPTLKAVRVVRILPNTLRIEASARIPVAQMRLERPVDSPSERRLEPGWYVVDEDGFIPPGGRTDPMEDLVQVVGLEEAGAPVLVGQVNTSSLMARALRVIRTLRESPVLVSRQVTQLDMRDASGLRFVLEGETEVRCGSEADLGEHLERLRTALNEIARRRLAVHSIDLRFEDTVVRPKS